MFSVFPSNSARFAGIFRKMKIPMVKISAKIRGRNPTVKKAKIVLDTISEKGTRGRPRSVRPAEIRGRADNYRWILDQVWERLCPLLATAQNEEEVTKAFEEGAKPYDREFVPLAPLAFKVLREKKFPKLRRARVNFLADSLAGVGRVKPRRSRDICDHERLKEKRVNHIIRYEFYVECSCGYKGRSWNHACAKCRAKINFGFGSSFEP